MFFAIEAEQLADVVLVEVDFGKVRSTGSMR